MPPGVHSEHGASKAHRWMECPGSVLQARGLPDESSRYAREGTAAHEILEDILRGGEASPVGSTRVVEGDPIEVTQEMLDAVWEAVEYVRDHESDDSVLMVEVRFDFAPLDPPAPMFGTSDVVIWHPESRHLDVIDYKHGAGVAVDVAGNPQLLYYALGAVLETRQRPDSITLHVVQPRGHHPAGTCRSWDLGPDELRVFGRRLFEAAEATLEPGAPLRVGEWCRFCPALATCPAQRENAIEVAQTEFDAVPVDDLEGELLAPGALTPEQLSLVLERGDLVTTWIKAIHAYAVGALDRGETIPGYKLVEGRTRRRWVDEEATERYLAGKGLRVGERFNRKLVSPAQAEKALRARGELSSARKLHTLWESPKGRPKLAPEDSPKPALTPSAIDDFDADPSRAESGN